MPLPSRQETDTEITYTMYGEGDADPSYLVVHKTIPLSYTVKPSSLGTNGKTWQEMRDELDLALSLVPTGV